MAGFEGEWKLVEVITKMQEDRTAGYLTEVSEVQAKNDWN